MSRPLHWWAVLSALSVWCGCAGGSESSGSLEARLGLGYARVEFPSPPRKASQAISAAAAEEEWNEYIRRCKEGLHLGERRTATLERLARTHAWPRAGGVFVEIVRPGGSRYGSLLIERSETAVKVFQPASAEWLTVVKDDTFPRNATDTEWSQMNNEEDWGKTDPPCFFVSAVLANGAIRQVASIGVPDRGTTLDRLLQSVQLYRGAME